MSRKRASDRRGLEVALESLRKVTGNLKAYNSAGQLDEAILLLDEWAAIADILTYYQEEIASEDSLRWRATQAARSGTLNPGKGTGWKYLPIRRLALFVEASVSAATRWAVFEPNDETLWSRLRSDVDEVMRQLFQQGEFKGNKPDQAYFVKCDLETTTQADIDNGIVNIVVGFAPLVAAEFVVIRIQQMTGQQRQVLRRKPRRKMD